MVNGVPMKGRRRAGHRRSVRPPTPAARPPPPDVLGFRVRVRGLWVQEREGVGIRD